MAKILTIFLAALMGLATLGAVDCLAGADYWPLKEGSKWEYEGYKIKQDRKVEQMFEWTVLPERELDGVNVAPLKMVIQPEIFFLQAITLYCFLVDTEEGLKIVASQLPQDSQPKKKLDWEYKYPLQVGKSWTADEPIRGLKDPPAVQMTHTIKSMDETVTVKAGTFEKCMKITGRYSGKVNLGSYGGSPDIVLESERWYAPGIGQVKHHEKQTSSDPKMGTVERYSELKSYKK